MKCVVSPNLSRPSTWSCESDQILTGQRLVAAADLLVKDRVVFRALGQRLQGASNPNRQQGPCSRCRKSMNRMIDLLSLSHLPQDQDQNQAPRGWMCRKLGSNTLSSLGCW